MADDKFKLPNSSYEELTKIIKSYGNFHKPVGLDEVSRFIGMDTTVISRNLGFLIELGLILSGQKKALSSQGKELSHALEHKIPDEIRRCWQKVVDENDFVSKLVTAIKIRNGMDENTLQSHIAYSAGQPKKPQFMTGARTIIDILRAAELIQESDGKFVVSAPSGRGSGFWSEQETSEKGEARNELVPSYIERGRSGDVGVSVKVNINISCTVDELDDVADKIGKLLRRAREEGVDLDLNIENE